MKVCTGDEQHGVTCAMTWQSGDSDSVASVTEAAVSNTLYKHWVEAAATQRPHQSHEQAAAVLSECFHKHSL